MKPPGRGGGIKEGVAETVAAGNEETSNLPSAPSDCEAMYCWTVALSCFKFSFSAHSA